MKAFAKKYYTIAIALLLVFLCALSLDLFDNRLSEFAVVSIDVGEIELDITVSRSLSIVKIEPISKSALEETDLITELAKRSLPNAVKLLGDRYIVNTNMLIIATAHENKMMTNEDLLELATDASSLLDGGYTLAYAIYDDIDMSRLTSAEAGIGKIAWTDHLCIINETITDMYIDRYYVTPADADYLSYYIKYLTEGNFTDAQKKSVMADASKAVFNFNVISAEEALDRCLEGSEAWFGDNVTDFSLIGLTIAHGKLEYRFTTHVYGYETYAHVDAISGKVVYDDES